MATPRYGAQNRSVPWSRSSAAAVVGGWIGARGGARGARAPTATGRARRRGGRGGGDPAKRPGRRGRRRARQWLAGQPQEGRRPRGATGAPRRDRCRGEVEAGRRSAGGGWV